MSETIVEEAPVANGQMLVENNASVMETGVHHDDEGSWLYGKQKNDENGDMPPVAPSVDDGTTQEIDAPDKAAAPSSSIPANISLVGSQFDDDSDDDDDIQVTIGDIKPGAPIYLPVRQNSRTTLPPGPAMPPKTQATRGVDMDAQGMINGQPIFEHDFMNAFKDDEKPWKKPGADISDYFNYGFTEETWAQYCDRQRRLRSENNLARLNANHMPPMPQMMQGHPPMGHPMNAHPVMMMNKPPMNMAMMQRPFMNARKQDGKIDVIGATDQTSRRQMFEMANNFEHPPYLNGPGFPGGQPPNGQTVGDLVATPPASNGPPQQHGTPPGSSHPIQTLGAHRLPMMPPPHGMPFRSQYGHPHPSGAPPFFPHGPGGPMHGERPPQPYFMPHHPPQPWDKGGVPPGHNFPPGHFPPQAPVPNNAGNGRPTSSRSPTPEDHSSRSSTPEENRPSGNGTENDKSSKEDRYKDRYRDDRDHYSSASRRRPSSKERSSSSYRPRHRSGDHEYERPRGDRKSSRDRDDKYERYSRKRHHRDEAGRHNRADDEASRSHRSSRRTPTKNFSSPPKALTVNNSQPTSADAPPVATEPVETSENDPSAPANPSGGSPSSRARREESERSSSRHSHHKKSSKRSRRDSDDERSHHHRRHSKDKSSSSKKSANPTDASADSKEPQHE